MPPVFATAFMVGFIEWACIEAMRPWLEPGEHTVGTHVNVSHTAATPAGMNVTAFRAQSLEPDIRMTAMDADVIKLYVERGVGVGILFEMAMERRLQ